LLHQGAILVLDYGVTTSQLKSVEPELLLANYSSVSNAELATLKDEQLTE
jgi:hypothetical protein